jgi:hypothetical protein
LVGLLAQHSIGQRAPRWAATVTARPL